MGRCAGAIASLTVLAAGACGAPGASSTTSLNGVDDASPAAQAAAAPARDLLTPGSCLSGSTLAGSADGMEEAVARFGLVAYEEMADDPVWTDVVDCSRPHTFEIYGVVELPDAISDDVTSYTDLLETTGSVSRSIRTAVDHACALKIPAAADITAKAEIHVDVMPLVSQALGSFRWAPAPPSAWDAGQRSIGCIFEQPEPAIITVEDVMSGALPPEQRTCLDRGSFVSCDALHDVERIATLVVDRAVASQQLRGERAVGVSGLVELGDRQWSALDSVCQRYLTAVSDSAPTRLRGVADTYPELYPDTDGHYIVLCSAQSPFGTPAEQMTLTKSTVYDG
jgi:hypothetical protein